MALSKETVIDKREILELGQIQIRTVTKIIEDGNVISSSYHRHVIVPGQDISNEDAETQAIATALWTPEKISAYEASIQSIEE
jgi:hypothetical protein